MSRTYRWLVVVAAFAALAALPAVAGARSQSGSNFDATQLLGGGGMTVRVAGPMGSPTRASVRITFTVVDRRGHVARGFGWMIGAARWSGTARVPAGRAPPVAGPALAYAVAVTTKADGSIATYAWSRGVRLQTGG